MLRPGDRWTRYSDWSVTVTIMSEPLISVAMVASRPSLGAPLSFDDADA